MDVDEFLWWIIRIMTILVVSVVIVILLALLVPDVQANQLRADVLAARIAYSGGFMDSPGVVNTSLFTQQTADAAIRYSEDSQSVITTRIGARVTLLTPDGEAISEPIFYHRRGWDSALSSYGGVLGGENIDVREFPVSVRTDETNENVLSDAILRIEVLYAE